MVLDKLLPLDEAARRYKITKTVLHQRIASGKLRAAMVSGDLVVSETDLVDDLPRDQRPEYIKHAHLKGIGIGLREASRKYGVTSPSISRWVKRGLIAVIGKAGAQKLLLDEADVAYCAEIYQSNQGQGRWVFNDNGTPYRKTS